MHDTRSRAPVFIVMLVAHVAYALFLIFIISVLCFFPLPVERFNKKLLFAFLHR